DQPRVKLSEHPVLRTLCDEYRKLCLDAGEHEVSRFARLPDGTPLTQTMRELFRAQWLASERPAEHHETFAPAPAIPPHPFGPDHGLAFRYWMTSAISPHEAAAGMNRLVMHLWRSRVDLQVAFPAPTGASADGFRHWCRTHGLANGALPAWALPADPVPPEPPEDAFGVNLVGYLTAELGLGEMGRIVHHVAEDAAIPVASVTDAHSVRCQTVLDEPHTSGPPRYPVSILAVNSDFTESLLSTFPDVGHDRYRIGLWAWELTDFPPRMHSGFGALDEVWTVSDFTRAAVAAHSPVPVKTFPVPVLDPGAVSRSATRRPEDPVRFFFAFDYNSTGQRKNPWGLVRAFQQAFPDRPDARLVIKAGNGVGHPAAVERLRHTIGSDGRIQLIERYLTADELQKQYAGCDAYVSLHRSEGFGLTVAEAMARGIPVIATDYSATTEFFDDSVGWTVPYRLVPVGPGWEPYQADGHWAEPDLDAAARAMRAVAEHPELALRRGAAARERILRDRSVATAAEWVRAQVTDAYRMWRSRSHEDRSATAAIDKAAAALHWRADPGTARANPMAPALRRLVLRAIDHYDAHQRLVQEALLDGVREAIEQLTRESTEFGEAHAAGMREVAARLDAVEQELRNPDTRG
ncbi:MAG: glycosyltransferase, partial [Thermocrispum sp.]